MQHWHIVDWQSWPLESTAYPKLWSAAWSSRERYTLRDVAAVVEFARARGVRVVPEFDTPGHASSMCVGYPELCCSPSCMQSGGSPLSPVPDANGKNVSLDAINAVLTEISAITFDEFFHLGGDEVSQGCWNKTPAVRDWMVTKGYNTTDQVYEYFVSAVDAQALALGKSPIRWQEVWARAFWGGVPLRWRTHCQLMRGTRGRLCKATQLAPPHTHLTQLPTPFPSDFGTDLDKRTVIHAWLSSGALIEATNAGYRAIWSVDGRYYLDALDETWPGFYDVDVLAGVTNASAIPLVLGGETEMWGETADGSDVLQTIFPRAAAAAERQWSYDVVTTSDAPYVAERLQAFRCHMLERGIPCAPVTNGKARDAPTGPGSCTSQ